MLKRILVVLLMGLAPLMARAEKFEDGIHYLDIPFSQSLVKQNGGKVEVREFFWYGCGHCYSFEPVLADWLKNKPAHVLFVRTPAFLPKRGDHAKAYYAFEAMGAVDKLHKSFFDELHARHNRLENQDSIAGFVKKQGADVEAFNKAFKSFGVDSQVRQAQQLATSYGVSSVPTVVVDGRYVVTPTLAQGSFPKMLQIINFLVEKARKAG